MGAPLRVHYLGLQDYETTWKAMSSFTDERKTDDDDQLWVLQHSPVFTQGHTGKSEHLLDPGNIPVVRSDRGGQVTYHGPGQLVIYPLIDLRRRDLSVRGMVTALELTAVGLLAKYGIEAYPKSDAPGVYVYHRHGEAKIASLGLRIRRGRSFHGMSINVDMDLSPFRRINPCGYRDLAMAQLRDLVTGDLHYADVERSAVEQFAREIDAPTTVT
ncbi:MAG: lipoyl(octanoyl) transferase [Cellvibrionaceae bacterium]|jgi:lipoyl(octanoyl) transferase